MSRSGEVRLDFGLEERSFRLGIKQWEYLDEALEVGPSVLLARLAEGAVRALQVQQLFPALVGEIGRFRQAEPRQVLVAGLVGGGMPMKDAVALVRRVEDLGGFPAVVSVAWDVVFAGYMGVRIEDPAGEPAGAEPSPPSQADASGSAATVSTPSEPPSASPRRRSAK